MANAAAATPAVQALAKAKASGKPVTIDTLTTASSQTMANPDGTFTLDETSMPARTHTAHGWVDLDATLHRNPDGTLSPAATTSPLVLSGGGTAALARMSVARRTMAVSFPATLPAPTLSGATATYRNVLPSVDLVVTADAWGGFSEVLVVKNAAAAANPALASLTLTTTLSPGLTLHTDPSGSITASTVGGAALFTAPPPRMWDSATTAAAPSGTKSPLSSGAAGLPVRASSVTGPGTGAHQASLKATARQGAITLTPDSAVLKGPGVRYPVYLDPQYTANNGIGKNGWASVPNPNYYTGNYWDNTPDPDAGTMQVGNAGTMWSHTLMNLPIPVATLAHAHIYSATVGITEIEAYSCTKSWVDIYAPNATLTPSNANWSAWPASALGGSVDRQDVAYGLSGCAAAAVGFNVFAPVTNDISAGKNLQTFALTGENESSDYNSWKEFSESSAHLSIVYENTPNVPTQASTSPGGACQTGAPSADVIGNDDVTFSVYASTIDTGSSLTTEFIISNYQGAVVYDSAAHNTNASTGSSGYATLPISRATIQSWNANGTTTAYQYSWTAKTSDGTYTSTGFTPCTFTYNPAYPSSPGVKVSSSNPTLGQTATITLAQCTGLLANPQTACPSDKPAPVSYVYQLDNGPSAQVTATGTTQTITLPMTHAGPNTITAYAIAAGGNPSPPINSPTFTVAGPATAYADGDLTGSGHPDLLYPGTSANPGLWLAASDGAGNLSTPVDIGPMGTGVNTTGSPADWAGAQILHGNFSNRSIQDVLAYYPAGTHAGYGELVYGTGDTSPISPFSGNKDSFDSSALADPSLGQGDLPVDLVAAGDASQSTNTATTPPDLIGINGTSADGYELDLFSANPGNGINTYSTNATVFGAGQSGVLSTKAPDGGAWGTNWTLATAQPSGNPVLLALNTTTGTLWESTNPTKSTTAVIGTDGTWTQITTVPWSASAHNIPTAIPSADINAAGNIELWTIASGNASATAYTLTGTTLATETTTSLLGPSHEWPLTDGPGATTAVDTTGNTPANLSSSGATWTTDNLFTPDVTLDGTNGYLTSTTSAVSPSASFTIDAWIYPTAAGGVALSQDGTNDSDFLLYPNGSQWEFGINTGNTSTWSYDGIAGGSYLDNVWNHLTVTYNASTKLMSLYDNGVVVAAGTHNPVSSQPAGAFRIGDDLADGSHGSRFGGQVSAVRTWSQALNPTQVATLANLNPPIPFTTNTTLRNVSGGLCLDAFNSANGANPSTNGDNIQLWTCDGFSQQNWTFHPVAGNPGWYTITNGYGGLCLDAFNSANGANPSTNGDAVQLWTCDGFTQQEWQYTANNTLKNYYGGLLLDATTNSTTNPSTNGDKIQLWTATGAANQAWF